MIFGAYIKSKPKNKWYLMAISASAETAKNDVDKILQQARKEGNEQAEAAIQTFDSSFYIPETLSEIKQQKPMLN